MPDNTDPFRGDPSPFVLRPAGIDDIPALLTIEARSFQTDRLTRRNFHHLITRGHAVCLVEAHGPEITGYALVLFNNGTSLARLYSFAVDPAWRGRGVGRRLLSATEIAAREHDCAYLRLEVRRDNAPAITLYKRAGYREFGVYDDYYEDHMEALRLEKRLPGATVSGIQPGFRLVPYYQQTLEFTCGPSALMMAMRALDPAVELSRKLEIRIWRESTTVFMTSGHGGCGPMGLALSAWKRGFAVDLYVNDGGAPFLDGVRSDDKKAVMRLVHEDFLEEIAATGIRIHHRTLPLDEMCATVRAGAIPIVLISSYRIYHEKFPHWIAVTGIDDKFIYAHDPLVEHDRPHTDIDRMNMPIPRKEFERMARYGKAQLKATLVLQPRAE